MGYEPRLPEALRPYSGQIIDVDSHEMLPAQEWEEAFGPIAQELVRAWTCTGESNKTGVNHPNVPDWTGDVLPFDAETVWKTKGSIAPGAVDVARRDKVMDAMGVSQQLMFPTAGMFALMLACLPQDHPIMKEVEGDRKRLGRAMIEAYGEWAMRQAKISQRVRPVPPIMAENPEELVEKAKRLIDGGIRALWLPSGTPPGGRSPASYALDPFWDLLSSTGTAACLHISSESFLETYEWQEAEVFKNFRVIGDFTTDPFSLSIHHWPTQNFLQTVVVGGVFERHPDLRFGALETSAIWVGPMMDHLDVWWEFGNPFGTEHSIRLPRKPSDYVRRNVRVSPYDFEPVGRMIDLYPGMADILCFATDYPHVEGGRNPIEKWYDEIKRHGPEVAEKFFVNNGQWLFP